MNNRRKTRQDSLEMESTFFVTRLDGIVCVRGRGEGAWGAHVEFNNSSELWTMERFN